MSRLKQPPAPHGAEEHPPTRYNPPGRGALSYGGGRYAATLRRMLARLPAERPPGGGAPLAALNRDVPADWSIALVHAWAVATEVLGFYQERIVNEGYLGTAAEERSVLELARAIGYEPRPGVAASAHLAFTVLEPKDEPARHVFIPAGCAALSVPPQGRLPQTFETDEPFTARSEWNLIRPELAADAPAPLVDPASPGVRLAGVGLALQPGDPLLLVGRPEGDPAGLPPWLLAEVVAATPEPRRGQTAVSWRIVAREGGPGGLAQARVFALRPPAPLFPYSSGGVQLRAPSAAWGPASLGMPGLTVRALARAGAGALLAATARGVYRSADGAASWQPAGAGLGPRGFHALAAAPGGQIYAGGEGGLVALSADEGATWTTVSGELPRAGRGRTGPMPRTVVRALAAERRGGRDRLVAGTDDGILRSADGGRTWEPANAGLPKVDSKTGLAPVPVRALAPLPGGREPALFAATDAGVFRAPEPPRPLATAGLALLAALALIFLFGTRGLLGWLADSASRLINLVALTASRLIDAAATAIANITGGPPPALPSVPGIAAPPDPIGALQGLVAGIPLVGERLAGLLDGPALLFLTDVMLLGLALFLAATLAGAARRALARRPAASLGRPVGALAAGPDGRLYAVTAHGLLRSNDGAERRTKGLARARARLARLALGDGARAWEVVTLAPGPDGALAAGAAPPSGQPAPFLDGAMASALAAGPAGELLAGLAGGAVLRSADGLRWERLGVAPLAAPLALLPLPGGELLAAGAPPEDPVERDWSPWHLRDGLLDLAVVDPALQQGDLLLLRAPGGAAELRRAAAVAIVESGDPARPARLTRVRASPPEGLGRHPRGALLVAGVARPLPLADDRPVAGSTIVCAGFVPGLALGQTIVVSGRRARALAPPGAALLSPDRLRADPLQPGEPLVVTAAPARLPDGREEWRVLTRDGRAGLLSCSPGALALAPSLDDDPAVSELARVHAARHSAAQTTITLEQDLANVFDRATVALNANVVRASHGATVAGELLGASEAMSVNQRFTLGQPPLTYVATPEGVKSTLEVTVNGVRWDQALFLHASARDRRAYMVRRDAADDPPAIPPATDEGGPLAPEPPRYPAAELIFGDAVEGAGLPTGTWRIEASYRSGIGTVGNVPGGSLSVLQRAPRGLKSVTNPLPAGGGVDPEAPTEARARAPLGLRAMERVVTPADIEGFARTYPGVSKVRADLLAAGGRRLMYLTIADADAGAESLVAEALAAAIAARRSSPTPPVYVGRCALARFSAEALLQIEPAHRARVEQILAAARAALVAAFSFDARDLAQPAAPSELIALLQGVAGVAAVELRSLRLDGGPAGARPREPLGARAARREGGALLPAELLLIDATSDRGIVLEAEL